MNFQNPYSPQPISLYSFMKSLVINRQLILQMTRREVLGRYKGSIFGMTWSLINPILMLSIYTFVFSVVFKVRWGEDAMDSKTQFALLVFVGMIVLGLFTEAVNRSPSLIIANSNYVKKVVFPLEILPIITLCAALVHTLISLLVLAMALLVINHQIHWTFVLAPIVLGPLLLFTLGITWALAALGVFIRDIGQTISILTTILMFISPVFYPVSALPSRFQGVMMLNPLTFIIEQCRVVTIDGQMPDWFGLVIYTLISLLIMWLGYAWFQKTRKGFADVL